MVLRGLWKCYLFEFGIAGTTDPFTHPSSLEGGLQKLVSFFHSRSLITKFWSVPWVDCERVGGACSSRMLRIFLLFYCLSEHPYVLTPQPIRYAYKSIIISGQETLYLPRFTCCMWFIQHLRSLHFAASSRLARLPLVPAPLVKFTVVWNRLGMRYCFCHHWFSIRSACSLIRVIPVEMEPADSGLGCKVLCCGK